MKDADLAEPADMVARVDPNALTLPPFDWRRSLWHGALLLAVCALMAWAWHGARIKPS